MAGRFPFLPGDPRCPILTPEELTECGHECLEDLRRTLCLGLKAQKHFDHLRAKKILSREDTEEISCRTSSRNQNGLLLDFCQQHPNGFQALMESCNQEQGQKHLAELLREDWEKKCGDKLAGKWWDAGADGRNPCAQGGGGGSDYTALLRPDNSLGGEGGGSRSLGPSNSNQSETGGAGGPSGGGPYNYKHDGERVGGGLDQGGGGDGAGCGGPNLQHPHGACGDFCEGCQSRYYDEIGDPAPDSFESSGNSGGGGGGGVRYHADGEGRVDGLPEDPQETSDTEPPLESRGGPDPKSPPRRRKFFCC
ncbi:apoptosis regulator E10 [Equid gammaherpesvirus 2]|nr:apoptosis regulator E10 [Equid gammaherpesvirus 2]